MEWRFDRESPALVRVAVVDAVRRWQMRRVDEAFPTCGLSSGFRQPPLRKLLRASDGQWGPAQRAQLRSALVGGQWPQVRLYRAGCADSPLCSLCGASNGTLSHRLWFCEHPLLADERRRNVPQHVIDRARAEIAAGKVARWERALFPLPELPSARRGPFDTFDWDVEPEGGAAQGVFYTDASRCGGADPLTSSYGWAFVARDEQGHTVAAAHVAAPSWVRSVVAAETWALAKAAAVSIVGSAFRLDCLGVSQVFARGRRFATSAKQVCAAVWCQIFSAIDGGDAEVSWIPAHTAAIDIGHTIPAEDRDGNDAADELARRTAREGTPLTEDAKRLRDLDELVTLVARWIGIAGVITSQPNQRDTTASQKAKGERRAAAAAARAAMPAPPPLPAFSIARPYALGGHILVECAHGWRCRICRISSSSWNRLASQRCSRTAEAQCAFVRAVDPLVHTRPRAQRHTLWLSDQTVWCSTCGHHATEAVKGLRLACQPVKQGTRFAKRLLCSGIHPATRRPFDAAPVPQHQWQSADELAKHALSLPDRRRVVEPRGCARASQRRSGTPPTISVAAPLSAAELRMAAMVARVRAREREGVLVGKADTLCRRRLRGKQPPTSLA